MIPHTLSVSIVKTPRAFSCMLIINIYSEQKANHHQCDDPENSPVSICLDKRQYDKNCQQVVRIGPRAAIKYVLMKKY